MIRNLEFRNVRKTDTQIGANISADLYLDNKFVITLVDEINHLRKSQHQEVTLYKYFCDAMLKFLNMHNVKNDKQNNGNFVLPQGAQVH